MSNSKTKGGKKCLNAKQKKVLDLSVLIIQILVVIIAIIISAIVLANPSVTSATVGKGKTKLLPVLTNSMAGSQKDSFNKGDLVIATKPKDATKLEIGNIVTFKANIDGLDTINTHRIIEKNVNPNGTVTYVTKGDNASGKDTAILSGEVLAVYKYHLKGVGDAIFWLQKPTNFLLVIVLPLALLFIYNIVMFVRMIMVAKLEKLKEGANGNVAVVDEEEIKRKAIEEYMAQQKAQGAEDTESDDKDKPAN